MPSGDVIVQKGMEGNSNRSFDGSGMCETQKAQTSETFNHAQCPPVTAQPQISRFYKRLIRGEQTNSRGNIIGEKPLINYAVGYGQNIRCSPKMSHHSDQSSKSNLTDTVVINFDNINELSHSMDKGGTCTKFQPSISSIESSGPSDQNVVGCVRETTVDMTNVNRISSCHTDVINSNNNNNNNDGNNSGSNNNGNISVIQNTEGTRTESPDSGTQSLEKIFNNYIPFITFLLLKAIYDHREGILIFVALLVTFIHANYVVKREIAKQSRRSLLSLGIIFVNLFVSICFIYFVFKDQHLYNNLIFIPPYSQPLNIWDVLWIVGITDFVLKFITIQLKVGMTCFPAKLLPYSARGKWYLLLERTSQLYRGLVPIQPWLYYLMEVYQGPDSNVGMFFSVAYVVSKWSDLKSKVKLFLRAFFKLLRNASLGVRPSNEQLVGAGSHCPICHDDYNSPIILQCRHVFCEGCVTTWFDREQTCPLCRAKIADDPSWRDGATSLFTQLF